MEKQTREGRLSAKQRIQRLHRHGKIVALSGLVVVIALGAGYLVVNHHSQAQTYQTKVTRQANRDHVSCTINATPNSLIYIDGNEIGKTNSDGQYLLADEAVGSRVQVKFGRNTSAVLKLARSDQHGALEPSFSYLKGQSAQKYLDQLYRCLTNLANHNDQTSHNTSLDNYYQGGQQNSTYQKLFQQGKTQYAQIRHGRHHQDHSNTLQAVHFLTHVTSSTLNRDGSVTLNYAVKSDLASPKHDKITQTNWTATLIKVNGNWKVVHANPVSNSAQ